MWTETLVLTVLVTGIAAKLCIGNRNIVTTAFRDRVYHFTNSVLAVYMMDVFLLRVFNMPLPLLHEATCAGAFVSILIIIVAILNLMCAIDSRPSGGDDDEVREQDIFNIFGIGVCIFWIMAEIMGLLEKLHP